MGGGPAGRFHNAVEELNSGLETSRFQIQRPKPLGHSAPTYLENNSSETL